jgi:peptide/nickel transport system substrate-binding protein
VKARNILAVPLLAGALALAACGGAKNQEPTGGGASDTATLAPVTSQDINPKDRADLQQGGTLRLDVAEFGGGNWNILNVNGNNLDLARAMNALLPLYFYYDAKGVYHPNPNFVISADQTNANPTTIHVKLNPKAVWGDGSPVDVDDFTATWKALNGSNKKFQAASTDGWDSIASVTQGADKFDFTVTWKGPYPDWDAIIGSGVLKAESVKDPDTFNTGWSKLNNDWLSGPFKVESFNETQKLLTEVPNDKWWGDKPLLDKITYRAISPDATAAAFVNNELDSFDIGPDPDAYKRASGVQDATVRKAAGPNFRHITFNQKAGLLTDKLIRQSIVRGLDRAAIGASDLAGIDWAVTPLNNIFLLSTQEGYEDDGKLTGLDYDPEKAKSDLDAAGWKAGADGIREKDGKKLEVKFSQLSGVPVSENEALQIQNQLKEIGIKVDIVNVPVSKFQDGSLLSKHEFELVAFSWIGTPHPFTPFPKQLAGTGSESNFTQVSIPEVDKLIPTLATETDPAKRAAISNQISKLLWEDVSTLPLYQRPALIATKTKLANYGAFGLSDRAFPWENVGYEK